MRSPLSVSATSDVTLDAPMVSAFASMIWVAAPVSIAAPWKSFEASVSEMAFAPALKVDVPVTVSEPDCVIGPLAVTARFPATLVVPRSMAPPAALRLTFPLAVASALTANPPAESLTSIEPAPPTLASVRVAIVVSRSIPVTALADRLPATTFVAAPLPSVMPPVRAVSVTAFPAEVRVALLAIAPPTSVTSSLKTAAAPTVTAPVPSAARPMVIEPNPLASAAMSPAVTSRLPAPLSAAPPMTIGVAAASGCKTIAPVPVTDAAPPFRLISRAEMVGLLAPAARVLANMMVPPAVELSVAGAAIITASLKVCAPVVVTLALTWVLPAASVVRLASGKPEPTAPPNVVAPFEFTASVRLAPEESRLAENCTLPPAPNPALPPLAVTTVLADRSAASATVMLPPAPAVPVPARSPPVVVMLA